jgi:hypothetical protein
MTGGRTVKAATESIRLASETFPRRSLDRILQETRPFTDTGHFLYPDDDNGSHTEGFFAIEPVTRSVAFVDAIVDDIESWADRESIDVDVIFSPAQPSVRPLTEGVGARLERPTAYWEYLPSGRYGDRLVEGSVPRDSKALALNGVSLQGRCVGLRLPQFVEGLGGTVVAAAVFAKGTADLVKKTEERLRERFYSTIQVDLPIYLPSTCPACESGDSPPRSWREFAEAAR